jgi:uncharacterized protein
MRIDETERRAIREAVRGRDPEAEGFLFGSRVDDGARGGDIDVLVLSKSLDRSDVLWIETDVMEKIDEQKIDWVLSDREHPSPFAAALLASGKCVPLS